MAMTSPSKMALALLPASVVMVTPLFRCFMPGYNLSAYTPYPWLFTPFSTGQISLPLLEEKLSANNLASGVNEKVALLVDLPELLLELAMALLIILSISRSILRASFCFSAIAAVYFASFCLMLVRRLRCDSISLESSSFAL